MRTTTHATVTACAAIAACAALSAPALAQQPAVEPGPEAATAALETAEATLSGNLPATAPAADATVALNAVAAAAPQLEGAQRQRAEALLARPTDGPADRYGDGYPKGAPVASAASAHSCVFWVDDRRYADAPSLADSNGVADGDGVPDYVEAILETIEYSYAVEVAPGPLGWEPPKPDVDGCGADPSLRADFYLKELGRAGIFGYESPDPGQTGRSQYGYLVIDNDYGEFGFSDPLDAARVTIAHEYNHLLQQNYDSLQDVWVFEGTAVWTEEQVYPEINDYVNYVSAFAGAPDAPITQTKAAQGLKIYGSAVWSHWLSGSGGDYGIESIRRAWEVSDLVDPRDFGPSAYDRAIRDRGGKGFSHEFSRFTAATAEWRAGEEFPDATAYPEIKRKGSLDRGDRRTFALDHTAYRVLGVGARGGAEIELKVEAEDGVRSGIALVGRQGGALSGKVTRKVRYLDSGGTGSVRLSSPGRFDRITAVIANADARVKGFAGGDWVWSKDDREYRLQLTG